MTENRNNTMSLYKWVAAGACAIVLAGGVAFTSYVVGIQTAQWSEIGRIAITQTDIKARVIALEAVVLENRDRFKEIYKKLEAILIEHQRIAPRR